MNQRGQALVGVMVVMVILFALAGAVAIGASTLLASRSSAGATMNDFRLRSAVDDSVAQVAGSTSTCWAAPAPSPSPTSSPIPTPLALTLPSPDGTGQAQCVRMDGVTAGGVSRLPAPAPGLNGCRTLGLGKTGPMRVAVLFDVFMDSGWATVDGSPTCPGTAPVRGAPCTARFPPTAGSRPPSGPVWTQIALTCDLADSETAMLHIHGTSTSPGQVFVAQQTTSGSSPGSVYLLAIQSPVGGGQMEEALLYVSSSRASQLLFEAPLQP
jgi:hypothetical protein